MNKIYTLLFFSFFFFGKTLIAQTDLACDGERYIDDVFSDVNVTTVTYGSNANIFGLNQNLRMDIYEPAGDVHTQRPVIIFAFGGSFIVGSRLTMASYCEQFAKKGYVAATIDYRLGFLGNSEAAVTGAVMRAVSDMKAAVRYFRQDADTDNEFKIHPDFILVGGYSAGAITALHAAYLDENDMISTTMETIINDNGGFEGDTGDAMNQSYSSEVFAVYSLSGGLAQKEWLDANETEPLTSYHGKDDGTVPFMNGLANNIAEIDGSGLLHQEADSHGLPNYLKSVDDGGHLDIHSDLFYQNDLDEFNLESSIFLQNQMCPDFTITNTENVELTQQYAHVSPNPSNHLIQFDFKNLTSDYDVKVFDQLGRLVAVYENQNEVIFTLEKNKIGEGMFFVNVLFEDVAIAPLTKRIIFN